MTHAACASVQVIESGLGEETTSVVDYDECLTPAQRLLPRLQPQPKPGEPQVQPTHLAVGALVTTCCMLHILAVRPEPSPLCIPQ